MVLVQNYTDGYYMETQRKPFYTNLRFIAKDDTLKFISFTARYLQIFILKMRCFDFFYNLPMTSEYYIKRSTLPYSFFLM